MPKFSSMPELDGDSSSGDVEASTFVCESVSTSRFGRSAETAGQYGSKSSRMQRCTRRRAPSYATASSPSNTSPVTESLMGKDMNMGDG